VDALDAIERYNGVQLDGKPMKIEPVGTKTEPPPTAPLMYNNASTNYIAIPNRLVNCY
jgi:THO complex subunit 4